MKKKNNIATMDDENYREDKFDYNIEENMFTGHINMKDWRHHKRRQSVNLL